MRCLVFALLLAGSATPALHGQLPPAFEVASMRALPGGRVTVTNNTLRNMLRKLGLKLDPQYGPVDVIVIDSVERPVED
jgi:hypothetical protein